jgi:hypothetical protein
MDGMDQVFWGYDFECGKPLDAMLAAFNSGGAWQWKLGDSDVYGDYLKCQPKEHARIRVYDARRFWMWRAGDPEGFWAELSCGPGDRAEIDRGFLDLLRRVEASDISQS